MRLSCPSLDYGMGKGPAAGALSDRMAWDLRTGPTCKGHRWNLDRLCSFSLRFISLKLVILLPSLCPLDFQNSDFGNVSVVQTVSS